MKVPMEYQGSTNNSEQEVTSAGDFIHVLVCTHNHVLHNHKREHCTYLTVSSSL